MAASVQKTTGGCREARDLATCELASPSVVDIANHSYPYCRFIGAVPEEGTGLGFGCDAEGHIVTNYFAARPTPCAACCAPASRPAKFDLPSPPKDTAKNPT